MYQNRKKPKRKKIHRITIFSKCYYMIIMSRESIRNAQIAEFLNRDRNRSSFVADAVRRGVSRFGLVLRFGGREQ